MSGPPTITATTTKAAIPKTLETMFQRRPLHKRIKWWLTFTFKGMGFVMCLLPGYIQLFWYYFISSDRKCVWYDDDSNSNGRSFFSRHWLDIYGSSTMKKNSAKTTTRKNENTKKPVLIFITGGTWQIHQRYFAIALGRALAPLGILVIVPDYAAYSSSSSLKQWYKKKQLRHDQQHNTDITDMINDVDTSIQWVFDHIEEYGGDRNKVVLVGQSAGAHVVGIVAALKMLDWLHHQHQQQEQQQQQTYNSTTTNQQQRQRLKSTYTPKQIRGYIPTAGPMNLIELRSTFLKSGILSPMKMEGLFGGCTDEALELWSPLQVMEKCFEEYMQQQQVELGGVLQHDDDGEKKKKGEESINSSKDVFPRFCAIHGTGDKCVPVQTSEEFVSRLCSMKVQAELITYEGWSHTDPIIEAPMEGNQRYHRDLYDLIRKWTNDNDDELPPFGESHPMLKPICPSVMVNWARACNPF
jgi:dienelactone hydrolase